MRYEIINQMASHWGDVPMKRTAIYLDDERARRLRELAADECRPLTAIVRDALDEYLARRGTEQVTPVSEPRGQLPTDQRQAQLLAALQRFRAGIDPSWTPEEIEADITAASEEVRRDRLRLSGRG